MQLSVVVPIYKFTKNCLASLPEIYNFLHKKFDSFEILFVVDHSDLNDNIIQLAEMAGKYEHVHVYQLNKNFGQHFATLCGYYFSHGEYIICVDEDMFHYLKVLEAINLPLQTEVLYLIYNKQNMHSSRMRRYLNLLSKYTIYFSFNLEYHTTFRIIQKSVLPLLLNRKCLHYNIDLLLHRLRIKFDYFIIKDIHLNQRISGYNFFSLSIFAIRLFKEYHHHFVGILLSAIIGVPLFLLGRINLILALLTMLLIFTLNHLFYQIQRIRTDDTAIKIIHAARPIQITK